MRAGQNGAFSSLGIQMRAFFQLRRTLCLVIWKHRPSLTTSVQANQPCPLLWSSGSFPFPQSVNSWLYVSRAPLQIIFSRISFSKSYWLWHLLCLLKHSADNRNLCRFSRRAGRGSLLSQKNNFPLKQYVEEGTPALLVWRWALHEAEKWWSRK